MEGLRRFLAAGVLLVLLLPSSAGARGATADGRGTYRPTPVEDAEDCRPWVPAAYATSATGNGQTISLDVLVLVDGAAKTDVDAIVAGAARIYSPLRVTLAATPRKWVADPALPTRVEANNLIAAARTSLGGARPAGFDLVHVVTTRDLVHGGEPITGYADCIGGVRYPTRAFSLSEAPIATRSVGPVNLYVDGTTETFAHEIGHILGARHEHANCAQGAGADDAANRDPSVCTLMTNNMELQSPNFGTLESLVVRGHTERYATP